MQKKIGMLIVITMLLLSFAGCGSEEVSEVSPDKAELILEEMDLTGDWLGAFTITSHQFKNLSKEELEGCEEEFGAAIVEAIVKQFDTLVDQPLGLKLNFQKEQDQYTGTGSLTVPAKLMTVLDPDTKEDSVSEFPPFDAVVENNELHFSINMDDEEAGENKAEIKFTGKARKENVLEGTFAWYLEDKPMIEGTWQVVLQ